MAVLVLKPEKLPDHAKALALGNYLMSRQPRLAVFGGEELGGICTNNASSSYTANW